MIGYEHTGVLSFVQGLLLGHPIHTISYTIFLPCRQPPLKKGNSQMESSVQDNPGAPPLLHRARCGSFSQKIETANPA